MHLNALATEFPKHCHNLDKVITPQTRGGQPAAGCITSCVHLRLVRSNRGSPARSLPVYRHCRIELATQWRDETDLSSSASIFTSFHRAFTAWILYDSCSQWRNFHRLQMLEKSTPSPKTNTYHKSQSSSPTAEVFKVWDATTTGDRQQLRRERGCIFLICLMHCARRRTAARY
jgi:hypothetical protein